MSADKRRGRPKGTGIDDNSQLQRVAALLAADPNLKPTTAIRKIGVNDPSVIRRLRDKFHLARPELMADVGDTGPAQSDIIADAVASVSPQNRPVQVNRPVQALTPALAGEAPRVAQARIAHPVRKAEPKSTAPRKETPTAVAGTPAAKAVAAAPIITPTAKATAAPVAAPGNGRPTVASTAAASTAVASAQPAPFAPAAATAAPVAMPEAKPAAPVASRAATTRPPLPPEALALQTAMDPSEWMISLCGFGLRAATTAFEAQVAFATQLVRLPQVALALRQHVMLNELALTFSAPRASGTRFN